LQRSEDGINFETIHQIVVEQNTDQVKHYRFEDINFTPLSYYRLLHLDQSEASSFSKIIALERTNAGYWSSRPNPFRDYLELSSMPEGPKQIVLRNVLGATVLSFESQHRTEQISTVSLIPGTYSLSIYMESTTITRKIIKE
jgi:hypothetical protein